MGVLGVEVYETWGWVEVYVDGEVRICRYGRAGVSKPRMLGKIPEQIKPIMAMLDLIPPGDRLKGGSWKDTEVDKRNGRITYYIKRRDLPENPVGENK